MKLPGVKDYKTEIHINDETYTIKFVKRIPGEKKDVVGLCDDTKRIIHVRSGLTKSQMFRTYLHEVLHAMDAEWEIKLTHRQVYLLEKALGDLFLSNF